jgi:glucose uptake protein
LAIPTTSSSAQLLTVLAFLLLGLWSSTFKMAGNRWRFELFSFDFAFGALAFALLSSYTLGSAGTDLGFSENLMLASRTNQALAFASGCLFAFGNILLLAAIALLGLSFAYALTTAAALLMLAAAEFNSERALWLSLAGSAALLVIIVQSRSVSKGEATLPAASLPVAAPVRKSPGTRSSKVKQEAGMKNSSKGIIVAMLAGLSLGGVFAPFRSSLFGQFGLGAYAGLVLFAAGVLAATLFLNLYFMNLSVQGGSIGLSAYLSGKVRLHLLGLVGGALCAAGILLLSLPNTFPADAQPSSWAVSAAALGAGVLALLLGLSVWRELAQAPGPVKRSALIGAALVLVAIGSFAIAMEKTPVPQPPAPQIGLTHGQLPG